MLDSIQVRNWQSLTDVQLSLGRFTVIVGASSSGKSALIRAFRALASNTSGTSAITRGRAAAAITARIGDTIVTLEHSKGAWLYRLVTPDGAEKVFTKLNRSVPPEISAALGLDPVPTGGCSINFASQFDPPYLLTDTGATVARTFGELTNVDRIFAAGSEATRQRKAAAALLKTRTADLEAIRAEAQRFAGLRERLITCEAAEDRAEAATRLSSRISRLQALVGDLGAAQTILERQEVPVDIPTDENVVAARQRIERFTGLLRTLRDAQKLATAAVLELGDARGRESGFTRQLNELLIEAGTCPTCNQPVNA